MTILINIGKTKKKKKSFYQLDGESNEYMNIRINVLLNAFYLNQFKMESFKANYHYHYLNSFLSYEFNEYKL